jgi:hypothetical protein
VGGGKKREFTYHSDEIREIVCKLFSEDGKYPKEIYRLLRIPLSTIEKMVKKFKDDG